MSHRRHKASSIGGNNMLSPEKPARPARVQHNAAAWQSKRAKRRLAASAPRIGKMSARYIGSAARRISAREILALQLCGGGNIDVTHYALLSCWASAARNLISPITWRVASPRSPAFPHRREKWQRRRHKSQAARRVSSPCRHEPARARRVRQSVKGSLKSARMKAK